MAIVNVSVPDIGDFKDVAIIEVLVKPGDTVKAEQSLVTVESDKASMEIPSSHAGVVKELKVALGDKINQGTVVLTLESADAGAAASAAPDAAPAAAPAAVPVSAPVSAPVAGAVSSAPVVVAPAPAGGYSGPVDVECDVLVLGGGPGGYSAAFRAADLGLNAVIV